MTLACGGTRAWGESYRRVVQPSTQVEEVAAADAVGGLEAGGAPGGGGHADGGDDEGAGVGAAGGRPQALLHRGEGARRRGADAGLMGLAGGGVETAGDVDGEQVGVLHGHDGGGVVLARRAAQAGA